MTTTNLESDVHLAAIRSALTNGNAAVMVGAGFSRNADGGHQLKTWDDVAAELWHELNPGTPMPGFSTSIVTQLGEQYARVFSVPALENLLKRLIPDDKVKPGELHEQLLQLPWSEIFTTNYDTLIERAAEEIVESAHCTVTCREDIPQSKLLGRRRIVKLHGSFPSQRPFIFTEEEYRRYPERFAPFVNLVRQSLLENVFCLIGFSGDDPNFLHWIGWVRDMLDRHALPIYLFVGKPPSLGQRKLLEARCVTPVVLPLPNECEPNDYVTRYSSLFRLLGTPLKPAHAAWGESIDIPSDLLAYTPDFAERCERLLRAFPELAKLRDTYPGWLVAPASVRRNFERSIERLPQSLGTLGLYEQLEGNSALVAIVLLAQYSWQQGVLLQCIDDRLAEIAIRLLHITKDYRSTGLPDSQLPSLKRIGVETTLDFEWHWRELSLGLLRWAREELRDETFSDLKELVGTVFSGDRNVADEVMHESVLLSLYQGERDVARRLLLEWDIRSLDAYMEVRKGALLAEVGETDLGLRTCMSGLQHLRRNQRSQPDSARYLSEEAWACLIIRNLQRAKTAFTFTQQDEDSEEARLRRRLTDLAAKGYDVRREREEIAARLNAEAPLPSESKFQVSEFDVGHYTTRTRLGLPSELQNKIEAAFAWLVLIDRVALVPRLGNVTFDLSSYPQAAWWTQYNNSVRRVLSVTIRTLSSDVLKPKDDSQPPHKTGWLSRFQVARLEEALARQVCNRSLSLVERTLASRPPQGETELVVSFHMEVFSRLVVRVCDAPTVFSFAEKLISFHRSSALWSHVRLWEAFATALARCFEALPHDQQFRLVPLIASIPEYPPDANDEHVFASNWLSMAAFWIPSEGYDLDATSPFDVRPEVARLVRTIEQEGLKTPNNGARLGRAWERLLWLNHFGLIQPDLCISISRLLWRDGDRWPVIPSHYPDATFEFPVPEGIDADAAFRQWILSRELASFGAPSSMLVTKPTAKKGWSFPVNNGFLRTWISSLSKRPWPEGDAVAGLRIVKAWWDSEWLQIADDMPDFDELHTAVIRRFHLLDTIFAKTLYQNESQAAVTLDSDLAKWIQEVLRAGMACGANFWQYRLSQAMATNNKADLLQIQEELAPHFMGVTSSAHSSDIAAKAALAWVEQDAPQDRHSSPDFLLDVLCSAVAARRMPNLAWALNILIRAVQHNGQWITDRLFAMLDLGLKALLGELSYDRYPVGSIIPDEDVPLLRLNCARLAFALHDANPQRTSQSVAEWLAHTDNDPLPEIRFMKERYCSKD